MHTISDLIHVEFIPDKIDNSPAVKLFRMTQLLPNYVPTAVSNILSYYISE